MEDNFFDVDTEMLFECKLRSMEVNTDINVGKDEVKNDNVANLEVYSFVEMNTFKLVRNIFAGEFNKPNDYALSEEVLKIKEKYGDKTDKYKLDIITINDKLENLKKNNKNSIIYKELLEKFKKLTQAYTAYNDAKSFKDAQEYTKDQTIRERKELHYYCKGDAFGLEREVAYYIIELKAALGLNLEYSSNNYITDFCKAIIMDVNNNKYKRLSIEKHFTSNKYIEPYL